MKVVVLCGGQGMRIRDVTDQLPKPMIPIGEVPILWHIMKTYAAWGHTEFVLCLGYKGDVIRAWVMGGRHISGDVTVGPRGARAQPSADEAADWQITLADGETPQSLLRELVQNEAISIEHFSIALPSLNDIFIRIVGDSEAKEQS